MADTGGVRLEIVGPDNLADCGIGCVMDRAHPGFQPKVDWLRRRFDDGLRFLLCRDRGGKPLAFLEYVPGEHAWRPIDAAGWLFVHCLWVYPRGRKYPGLGTRLIRACLDEARRADATGVAAMVSDGPWMAGRQVFLRNGFEVLATADRFELVAHRRRDGPDPSFRDVAGNLAKYRGLHIVYAPQCPYLPKSAADLADVAAEHGLELNVTVLDTVRKAQRAPSLYGVFSLIWNGRLLADHYISATRFRNIIRKEIAGGGR
jgi:hypothetical protein